MRIEPRESLFHTLAGDIALSQKNTRAATAAFTKAISLNPNFFYNYVQRGRINESQNNIKAAQADYARSVRLLPTAAAQVGLGKIAQAQGNTQVARRYFTMAAQAGDSDGQQARQALVRLQPDAANSVNTRLLVRQGLSRQGAFVIEVLNQTNRPVSNVQLGVTMGSSAQRTLSVRKTIAPGAREIVQTGRRMTQDQANQVKVVVLSTGSAR